MKNVFKVFGVALAGVLVTGCSSTLPRDVADRVDGKLAYAYVHHTVDTNDHGLFVALNFFQSGGDFINGNARVPFGVKVKSGSIVKVKLTKGMPSKPVDFIDVAAVDQTDSCKWVGGHGGFGAGGVVCDGWDYKTDLPFKGVSFFGKAY